MGWSERGNMNPNDPVLDQQRVEQREHRRQNHNHVFIINESRR